MEVTVLECVGGPFHGEMRVVDGCSVGCTIALPERWRKDAGVPEWVSYRVVRDKLQFCGRGTFAEAFEASFGWKEPSP